MKTHPILPLVLSLFFLGGCLAVRLIPPNSPLVDRPWLQKPPPLVIAPPMPPAPPVASQAQGRMALLSVPAPPRTNKIVMSATFPYFTTNNLRQTNKILVSTNMAGPFLPVFTNYAFGPTSFLYTNFTTSPATYYRSVRTGITNNEPKPTNGVIPL